MTDCFVLPLILESIQDKQTDKLRFISPLIGIQSDRRTHFFHTSYKNPHKTDWRTNLFSFHPHVCFSDRRTNVIFHSIYWNPSMTNLTWFHFYPHIGIQVRQTDKLLFIPQIWNSKTDSFFTTDIGIDARPTNSVSFLLTHYVGIYDRQTEKIRFISLLIFGAE